jgi:hypothetical protein
MFFRLFHKAEKAIRGLGGRGEELKALRKKSVL